MTRPTRSTLTALAAWILVSAAAAQDRPGAELQRTRGPYTDLARASGLVAKNRLQEAEKLLRSVVAAIPKHAEAWYELGLALALQGKKDRARAAAERAIGIDGTHVHALLLAGRLLLAKDKVHAAELAARAADAAKRDPVAQRKAARILLEAGARDPALALVAKLVRKHPKDQDLLYLQAELALATGKSELAIEAYQELIPLRRDDPWPSESIANIELQRGRKRACVRWLEISLGIRPSNLAARRRLIAVLTDLAADPARIEREGVYLRHYEHIVRARAERQQGRGRGPAGPHR